MFINLQLFGKYSKANPIQYTNPHYEIEVGERALFQRFNKVYNKWSFARRIQSDNNVCDIVYNPNDSDILAKIKYLFNYMQKNDINKANLFTNSLEDAYNRLGKERLYVDVDFIRSINSLYRKVHILEQKSEQQK